MAHLRGEAVLFIEIHLRLQHSGFGAISPMIDQHAYPPRF
jgi:hypothetical protein